MMSVAIVRHEMAHVIGDCYGLYRHALEAKQSFPDLVAESEVVLELTNKAAEVVVVSPSMALAALQRAAAYGALAPALLTSDKLLRFAASERSIEPIYHSEELSNPDRKAFDLAPIDIFEVIDAGLVVRSYLSLLGTRFSRFAHRLVEAAKQRDSLPLDHVVNIDRLTEAIKQLPEAREHIYPRRRVV